MNEARLLCALAFSFVIGNSEVLAAPLSDRSIGLEVYSALNFIPDEGEFYGLQITFVPYSGGKKLLWRSASGPLAEPLLLDFIEKDGVISVQLPVTSDDAGKWLLRITGTTLHATGPRNLKFDLRRLTIR